ncbi:hypothetical protein [Halomonas chromatireducens]|uniref:Uncharacterized protein n=1 Tax=Halomonas chromatireducens TaxID=507626 RepID=A0A109ULG6_9GAMM|nr:hypothetical protein [Halomonas chromatireducens]AMD00459.1 hypothetical protein LOKO_01391 [Halomonas chromatireducens]
MTYFVVMGSLALSVLFTFGWVLWRTGRWLTASMPGGRRQGGRGKAATRKPAKRPAQAKARKPAKKPSVKTRREPGRLTQWLAEWRATLPLAVITTLIYLIARLVEHGMSFRPPHTVPAGFHSLIVVLGWAAAVMLTLALINRLAAWRCR